MATFELPKNLEDVTKPPLLEDDWYQVKLVREPQKMPNRHKKAGKSVADGAGDNIVLNVRVIHDDPKINGRPLTKWLPFPNPGDDERYVEQGPMAGSTVMDAKLFEIRKWAAAFGGFTLDEMTGEEVDFSVGDEAMVYVDSAADFRDPEAMVNQISMNEDPRPVT